MLLLIGAVGSGKRAYLDTLGYKEADIADAFLDERPVLYNLQELVAAAPEQTELMLPLLLDKQVVVCSEVGSGIIPADKEAREFREKTGRLCILLANHADTVVRMVCGLKLILKGGAET